METAALIGLPQAGTSTLFDALTGGGIQPSGKNNLRRGDIKVPDPRIDHLSQVYNPKKTTHARVVANDVGGFDPDGKNLNKQLTNEMQAADALVVVLRAFPDFGEPAPAQDLEHILSTLRLSDYVIIAQRVERLQKQNAKGPELDLMQKLLNALEDDAPLCTLELSEQDEALVSGYGFLSRKPLIVVLNTGEDGADEATLQAVDTACTPVRARRLTANGTLEQEIAELPEEDQPEFLADLGLERTARDEVLRAIYAAMDLIPFFTVGEDEVRAWTIERGTPAVRAAGKIHSDLERGFIRAEVISYEDFLACDNSLTTAKEKGVLRLEGKEYVVRDGDIITVRFNV